MAATGFQQTLPCLQQLQLSSVKATRLALFCNSRIDLKGKGERCCKNSRHLFTNWLSCEAIPSNALLLLLWNRNLEISKRESDVIEKSKHLQHLERDRL